MLYNMKKDVHSRFVIFENLAKVLIRRQLSNNFIFLTRYFGSFEEIVSKYKLDISSLDIFVINFLNKHMHSLDLIGFELNDYKSRCVKNLFFYEVKTKSSHNKAKFDICFSSYNTYNFLKEKGFEVFLISFILFENWNYSFNIHTLNSNKFRVYSRYKKIL